MSTILFSCSDQKNPSIQAILFLVAEHNPLIFDSCTYYLIVLLENAKKQKGEESDKVAIGFLNIFH